MEAFAFDWLIRISIGLFVLLTDTSTGRHPRFALFTPIIDCVFHRRCLSRTTDRSKDSCERNEKRDLTNPRQTGRCDFPELQSVCQRAAAANLRQRSLASGAVRAPF